MADRESPRYVILFATAVCVACAFVVSVAAVLLQPAQKANARLYMEKNVLVAAGLAEHGQAMTVPEVGACTAADIQPSASPISCPLSTWSPACTKGRGVPPIDWCSGTNRRDGSGATAIGSCTDCVLLVCGLTPPLNLNSCSIRQPA